MLVAALVLVALAALASGTGESGRDVGFALARRLRCAAAGPGPCWRDPLTEAYGRSLAGAVRALAPAPAVVPGAGGEPLLPVDFRGCRTRTLRGSGRPLRPHGLESPRDGVHARSAASS